MKKFVSLMLVLGLSTMVFANGQSFANGSKLSKADSELLFGTSEVNAVLLSEEEMQAAKGDALLSIFAGAVVAGFGAELGKDIYSKIKSWFD